jgi:hypothetical protein
MTPIDVDSLRQVGPYQLSMEVDAGTAAPYVEAVQVPLGSAEGPTAPLGRRLREGLLREGLRPARAQPAGCRRARRSRPRLGRHRG